MERIERLERPERPETNETNETNEANEANEASGPRGSSGPKTPNHAPIFHGATIAATQPAIVSRTRTIAGSRCVLVRQPISTG